MNTVLAGVDLGGTSIKAAVGRADGSILAEATIPTDSHRGSEDVIDRIGALSFTTS